MGAVETYRREPRMNQGFPPQKPALEPETLTVSQLNRTVAGLLERGFGPLRVCGEISNLTRAASGHCYLTLKDAQAQVRAVMFRGRAAALRFVPREGDQVEVSCTASLYEARGEFQLNIDAMRPAGAGDLYRRFLALKEKLAGEGLFDAERKRAIPAQARCVGVVTSLQAAALRDVLTTLGRRAPQVPVIIYPTAVQGADAPAAIVAAIARANAHEHCDVLLVVRGGGSIEDLWAFNDEGVALAIAGSGIPVVSGVGHETDFTIADFVADLRAPTPTAAAGAVVADRAELRMRLRAGAQALARAMLRGQRAREQALDVASRLLRPPSAQWRERAQRLAVLVQRLARAQRARLQQQVLRAVGRAEQLELVSPVAVLGRGYAIVRDARARIVRDATRLRSGEPVDVLLATGSFAAQVTAVHAGDTPAGEAGASPPSGGAR